MGTSGKAAPSACMHMRHAHVTRKHNQQRLGDSSRTDTGFPDKKNGGWERAEGDTTSTSSSSASRTMDGTALRSHKQLLTPPPSDQLTREGRHTHNSDNNNNNNFQVGHKRTTVLVCALPAPLSGE